MIYLDYNATTPMATEVLAAMLPYYKEQYGNASSNTYALGWAADEAIQQASLQVAALIGATAKEIIFTSGATESLNLAMKGLVDLYWDYDPKTPLHIITVATEHSAVLATAAYLQRRGVALTHLGVDIDGQINIEELEAAMRAETVLVAVMLANNETGVLQPIERISRLTRARKVLLLSDCTQVPGKMPLNVHKLGIDMAALSAHKMYGPKGVGALYVSSRSPRVRLMRQMCGGDQQEGRRGGTLNVPGIVGMGAAASYVADSLKHNEEAMSLRRNALAQGLIDALPGSTENGGKAQRLPNVCNIALAGVDAKKLIAATNHQLAYSIGSACHADSSEASHVLQAMGLSRARVGNSIRLSLGWPTTNAEIEETISIITTAAKRLQKP